MLKRLFRDAYIDMPASDTDSRAFLFLCRIADEGMTEANI